MAFIPLTEDQWVFCQNLYKKEGTSSVPSDVLKGRDDPFFRFFSQSIGEHLVGDVLKPDRQDIRTVAVGIGDQQLPVFVKKVHIFREDLIREEDEPYGREIQ